MGNEKPQLYIRFPNKIGEELDVKNLCEDIESVHLPRQKSARWCIVDFKTLKHQQEALAILKTIKIEGKRLVVKAVKKKQKSLPFAKKSDVVNSVEELLKN